ncbi:nucleotidyltransferase domain-containing protein [Streptomyces virginiae]|uniref:nucleotidyltransferase domain-containing protein n=1 Tax=Streptomyces virginiae TaxID=1961 RepID=UPI00368AF5ED
MITRLEGGGWPLGLVEEVYVFGSYARGALEPNDVDVVIEHGTDKRWLGESLDASINGRDSYVGMRQALRGRTRGISFQFRGRSSLLDEGASSCSCSGARVSRSPWPASALPPSQRTRKPGLRPGATCSQSSRDWRARCPARHGSSCSAGM